MTVQIAVFVRMIPTCVLCQVPRTNTLSVIRLRAKGAHKQVGKHSVNTSFRAYTSHFSFSFIVALYLNNKIITSDADEDIVGRLLNVN